MHLKVVRRQTLVEKTFKTPESSDLAKKGYRLEIIEFIKNDYNKALREKGFIAECSETSLKIALAPKENFLNTDKWVIEIPQNMSSIEANQLLNRDEIQKTLEETCKTYFKENNFILQEGIINEGPVSDIFVKFAKKIDAAKAEKKDKNATELLKKQIATELTKEAFEVAVENIKISIGLEIEVTKTGLEISCNLLKPCTIIQGELGITKDEKGLYFKTVKGINGKELSGLTEETSIFEVLEKVADKLKVEMPKYKEVKAPEKNDNTKLKNKLSMETKGLTSLDKELYKLMGDEVYDYLTGLKEDLEKKDLTKYIKAYKAAKNNIQKGAVTQWLLLHLLNIKEKDEGIIGKVHQTLEQFNFNLEDKELLKRLNKCNETKDLENLWLEPEEDKEEEAEKKRKIKKTPHKEPKKLKSEKNIRKPAFNWESNINKEKFNDYNWGLSLNKYIAKLKSEDRKNGTNKAEEFKQKLLNIK